MSGSPSRSSTSLPSEEKTDKQENMDFKDALALYHCLSVPLTSDSEVSNEESCLPKVKEVVDADKLVNRLGKPSTSRDTSICEDEDRASDSSRVLDGKKPKKRTVQSQELEEGNPNEESVVPESEESRLSQTFEAEETTKDYEASEDCSTDYEQKNVLVPTRRKRTASGSSIPVYRCPFEDCGKEFNRPSRLVEHKRSHTGVRPHKCPEEGCGRTYTRKQHLQRHVAAAHQETKPQEYLKCDECGKLLRNKYIMAKHLYRAHVRENYKCEECGESFKKQQHLRSHSFKHTGIKPFSCDHPGCDEEFTLMSRLRRHSLKHAKKCYACPNESCELTFDDFKSLRKHLATNHAKVCDICGRMFRQLRQLKLHRKSHEAVREAFFCPAPNCDRHFYVERNFTKHYRERHEQTMIYQCTICSLRLASKQKLALHMVIHSPSYKRSYKGHNPRKPRKDKGISKTDYARLLSGYKGEEKGAGHHSSNIEDAPLFSEERSEHLEDKVTSSSDADYVEVMDEDNSDSIAHTDPLIKVSLKRLDQKSASSGGKTTQSKNVPRQTSWGILSEDDMEKLALSSDDVMERQVS